MNSKILTLNSFKLREYIWALNVMMTRQNEVPIDGVPKVALIPLWDMMNHQDGVVTTHSDPK